MKYYSDKTKKLYDTEKDLHDAEKALVKREAEEKAKREERSARAKEVEDAYNKYVELLNAFLKDYGHFHTTINNANSLFDFMFNHWPF